VDRVERGVFLLDFIKIVLEFIGALTILKYVFLEGKEVIAAGGNFICSIKKAINKVKNSK
jgi:hypothetical protein